MTCTAEIDFLFASNSPFVWEAEKEFTKLSALANATLDSGLREKPTSIEFGSEKKVDSLSS